jgi:hypothetical protein
VQGDGERFAPLSLSTPVQVGEVLVQLIPVRRFVREHLSGLRNIGAGDLNALGFLDAHEGQRPTPALAQGLYHAAGAGLVLG